MNWAAWKVCLNTLNISILASPANGTEVIIKRWFELRYPAWPLRLRKSAVVPEPACPAGTDPRQGEHAINSLSFKSGGFGHNATLEPRLVARHLRRRFAGLC